MDGKNSCRSKCSLVQTEVVDGSSGKASIEKFAECQRGGAKSGAAENTAEFTFGLSVSIQLYEVTGFGYRYMVP